MATTAIVTQVNPAENKNESPQFYSIEKIDFPCFSRTEVDSWQFQCEHYFELEGTLEGAKLKVAMIQLEG